MYVCMYVCMYVLMCVCVCVCVTFEFNEDFPLHTSLPTPSSSVISGCQH